ncbi:glycosyltransferase [Cohnella silvisoli]|uniref:Glycosyltransferase family A protein n=1 Tax=Cohnella silvisoli TaxID=2873699 RepID=A0ABV1KZD6_9BACL|nr:glycosyltransferase family A protein [Cohnella silvisoli]MCD9024749.1 glycosyltransferase [Cohnella silvisoli]
MSRYSIRHNGVSVITCTNRPLFFNQILSNYRRQLYNNKELIIILNKDSMKLSDYRKQVRLYSNITVYQVPQKFTLGRCLNVAADKAKYQFIAKFDDDDYYSPYYLLEQMSALHRSGASIVGKTAHFKYFEGKRLLAITSPKRQHKFVKFVAGGTLLFKKRLYSAVRFKNITLGEDVDFMRRSRNKGYKIYSSSPYNFVGIRRKNKKSHTWKASDEKILKNSRIITKTSQFHKIAVRPLGLKD